MSVDDSPWIVPAWQSPSEPEGIRDCGRYGERLESIDLRVHCGPRRPTGKQMRGTIKRRAWRVTVAVAAALVIALGAALNAPAAVRPLSALIDAVMRKGPQAQLPAHLSAVLGVGMEAQPTRVRQAILNQGSTMRTFNVCAARREDVVLIRYDERTRFSRAYLVSSAGVLRKPVAFQAGAPPVERSVADARGDFAIEIKFWTDFVNQPGGPR